MEKNGATYVLVGNRDASRLTVSIKELRKFSPNIPIRLYHEKESREKISSWELGNVELIEFKRFKHGHREENRNSSYWRLVSLLESPFENTVYLDNDVYIVHKGFLEGFEITKNYGIAMVQNPRMFIKTHEQNIGDIDIGVDVDKYDKEFIKDMPKYMTALNMGVIFYNKKSKDFLSALIYEQTSHCTRGQASLARAIWKTKTSPYTLPTNWLVCWKDKGIPNPIALHVGHEGIFNWWKKSFET